MNTAIQPFNRQTGTVLVPLFAGRYNHYFLSCILLLLSYCAGAQQIVRAGNVQLVSGAGVQIVSTGGITFTGSSSFTHNGQLTLLSNPVSGNADWLDSTAAGVLSAASSGHVLFKGTTAIQQVYGPTRFDSVTVQNAGVQLQQSNEIRKWLGLNTGLVYFSGSSDSIYVSDPSVNAISYNTDSLNTTSWVHGKLSRSANTTGVYFFPVGKIKNSENLYAPVRIEKANSNTATYSVQYFPASPTDRTNLNLQIDHISNQEYWEITSNGYASGTDDDATLSLSWRSYSTVSTSAATRDSLLIAHYYYNGGMLQWHPELNFSAANTITGNENFGFIKSNVVVGDFSMAHRNFTLGSRSAFNLLPVHISRLTATERQCRMYISFSTLQLQTPGRFVVEWSTNGLNWANVATITSPGSSNTEQTYSAVHNNPAAGANYYRIKQTGADGRYYYSEQTSANNTCGSSMPVVAPNPFGNHITISNLPRQSAIQLFDMRGITVLKQNNTTGSVYINTTALPRGHYVLQVTTPGGNKQTIKLVK